MNEEQCRYIVDLLERGEEFRGAISICFFLRIVRSKNSSMLTKKREADVLAKTMAVPFRRSERSGGTAPIGTTS